MNRTLSVKDFPWLKCCVPRRRALRRGLVLGHDLSAGHRDGALDLPLQRLPYFVGISGSTVGATGLSMHLIAIPPGGRSEPHSHRDYETAIYVPEGRVETRYGPGLNASVISEAGDFLFIPPGEPHEAINLSTTEPARAIVARNDPAEQDNVVLDEPPR